MSAPEAASATISVGGKVAVALFVLMLFAGVVESFLTQYAQTILHYHHPYFIFYLVHSAFVFIFPLHLLYSSLATGRSTKSLMRGLSTAISNHLRPDQKGSGFPSAAFLRLTLAITGGYSVPSVLWFVSLSLAPLTDVTSIGNTNAFWSYIISVKLFKLKWQPKRLLAVLCATIGTLAVIYGGAKDSEQAAEAKDASSSELPFQPAARVMGNICILLAALGGALYQVLYKIYAALPADAEVSSASAHGYSRVIDEEIPINSLDGEEELQSTTGQEFPTKGVDDAVFPLPFGLHSNLITSIVGFFTFAILWIPFPILHWTNVEPFQLPPDGKTWLVLLVAATNGVIYNAVFMFLLGLWGPVILSAGNLLTIVLVLIVDVVFGPGVRVLTFWTLLGSATIMLAFGVLSYDMFLNDT